MKITVTGRDYSGILTFQLHNFDWRTRSELYDLGKGVIAPAWDTEQKYMTYSYDDCNDILVVYYNSDTLNEQSVNDMIDHFKPYLTPSKDPIGIISCDITNENIEFYYNEEDDYVKCPHCGHILDSIDMVTTGVMIDSCYELSKDLEIQWETEQAKDDYYDNATYDIYSITCSYCSKRLPNSLISEIANKNEQLY